MLRGGGMCSPADRARAAAARAGAVAAVAQPLRVLLGAGGGVFCFGGCVGAGWEWTERAGCARQPTERGRRPLAAALPP